MNRPLVIDLAYCNGNVDFVKMKAMGIAGVYVRASWLYEDTLFKGYWKAAKVAGLKRGAYHYLDFRGSELVQANLFDSLIGNDIGELPPVLDLEMNPTPYAMSVTEIATVYQKDMMLETRLMIGSKRKPTIYYLPKIYPTLAPNQVQGKVWNWLQAVQKNTGKVPAIYTGFYYWNQWMTTDPTWANYKLWLAWYAAESIIKVPKPWTAWTMWQFTGNGNGPAYGTQSLSLDESWFNGDQAGFDAFAGSTPVPAALVCPWCGKVMPAGWSYVKP